MSKIKSVFDKEDFNSGDGMLTSIWGPPMWHSLHTISFNYPVNPTDKEKEHYMIFFKSLKNILPCRYCRDNLKKNLKILPLTKKVLKNRENLSRWVYQLHELVNTNLGKKSNLSYEMVRDRYENFRARCLKKTPKSNSKIENGCTDSLYGVKSKCILNIVPNDKRGISLKIDPKCKLKKIKKN